MSVNTLRNLCVEIFKTINKLNPEFMNNIFKVKENKRLVREQYKLNLETPEWNQVTFGAKSLKVYGSKVWNSLPFHIKTSENLVQFKSLMKKMATHVVASLHKISDSLVLFFYYGFYKPLDISFHTKILHSGKDLFC